MSTPTEPAFPDRATYTGLCNLEDGENSLMATVTFSIQRMDVWQSTPTAVAVRAVDIAGVINQAFRDAGWNHAVEWTAGLPTVLAVPEPAPEPAPTA